MDPAAERLGFIESYVRRMVREADLPMQIAASTEREAALDGANYVIASIRVGENFEPETLDVLIPRKVGGLRQTVSDTVGVGGIMKGLHTIPNVNEEQVTFASSLHQILGSAMGSAI